MPFGFAWTDQPSPQFERSFMQYHWSTRASWSPGKWSLDLGVWSEGQLLGTQGMDAENFGVRREVSTGSWLAREFQGQGIGKEMRQAVLGFAFDHLGAVWAKSGSFRDNPASAAVSRAVGYFEDGMDVLAPRGEPRELVRWRMHVEQWRSRPRPASRLPGSSAAGTCSAPVRRGAAQAAPRAPLSGSIVRQRLGFRQSPVSSTAERGKRRQRPCAGGQIGQIRAFGGRITR